MLASPSLRPLLPTEWNRACAIRMTRYLHHAWRKSPTISGSRWLSWTSGRSFPSTAWPNGAGMAGSFLRPRSIRPSFATGNFCNSADERLIHRPPELLDDFIELWLGHDIGRGEKHVVAIDAVGRAAARIADQPFFEPGSLDLRA